MFHSSRCMFGLVAAYRWHHLLTSISITHLRSARDHRRGTKPIDRSFLLLSSHGLPTLNPTARIGRFRSTHGQSNIVSAAPNTRMVTWIGSRQALMNPSSVNLNLPGVQAESPSMAAQPIATTATYLSFTCRSSRP